MGKQRASTLDALARYDTMVAEGHVMSKSLQTMAENLRKHSYAKNAKQVFKSNQLDEYVAAVNRFLDRGGTTRQIIEKVGVIAVAGEDDLHTIVDIKKLARRGGKETDKNPFGLSLRSMREGTNTNLNRKLNEEVPLKYKIHFKNDEDWERYKKYIRQGNVSNEKLTPKGFHKGHTTSISIVEASHDPFAQRLESATGNMSTGAKHDISRQRLQAAGTPTTWEESIDQFKNPRKYKKFRILTPQDKQRIYRGADPDDVILRRKAMMLNNKHASNLRRFKATARRLNHPAKNLTIQRKVASRVRRLPLIGGALGITALTAGDLISGDVQAAGQTLKDNWIDLIPGISDLNSDQPTGMGTMVTLDDETIIPYEQYQWLLEDQQQIEKKEEIESINQQHREFALAMEPKTSQTMATQLGNTVEKWATNPLNEIKWGYKQLLDFTKTFRN